MPFSWKYVARARAAARWAGDLPGEAPQLGRVLGLRWGVKRGRSRDENGLGLQDADGGFGHGCWVGCLVFLRVVRGGAEGAGRGRSRLWLFTGR